MAPLVRLLYPTTLRACSCILAQDNVLGFMVVSHLVSQSFWVCLKETIFLLWFFNSFHMHRSTKTFNNQDKPHKFPKTKQPTNTKKNTLMLGSGVVGVFPFRCFVFGCLRLPEVPRVKTRHPFSLGLNRSVCLLQNASVIQALFEGND